MKSTHDQVLFECLPGAKFFTFPQWHFTDLYAFYRGDTLNAHVATSFEPPQALPVSLVKETAKNYFSVYQQTWLPMECCAGESVVLDRNILVDLHNKRDRYKDVVKFLNTTAEVDLHCATLEGCSFNAHGSPIGWQVEETKMQGLIKSYAPNTDILSNSTLYRAAVLKDIEEIPVLASFCELVYPVYIEEPTARLCEIKKVIDLATEKGLFENSSFLSLLLNVFYQPEPSLCMYKAKDMRSTSNKERLILNMLHDVNYVRYMLNAWHIAKRPTRFLTADIALALYLTAHSDIHGDTFVHTTSYLFPNLSKDEFSFFERIGLISQVLPKKVYPR